MLNLEKTSVPYDITFESKGGVSIETLPLYLRQPKLNPTQQAIAVSLAQDKKLRESLESKIRSNSEMSQLRPDLFGTTQPRPLSSYYWLMKSHLILETGLVVDGTSHLHTDLMNAEGHQRRKEDKKIMYSGHYWKLPDLGEMGIAIFEYVFDYCYVGELGQLMIDTLTGHNTLCLSSTGDPLYSREQLLA